MTPPRKGDTFELIELAATCPTAQNREFQRTLGDAIQARGWPGVTYAYHRINARVIEITVHEAKGAKQP